jgi:predicted nucleic acid-binding protein
MNKITFFDTNVLLYMFDKRDVGKRRQAANAFRQHFQAGTLVISTQVIQEFYFAVTRKLSLLPGRAKQLIGDLCDLRVVTIGTANILRAADMSQRFKLSFWDGLILAAAEEADASVLFTEDLNHGQTYVGIRVVNPFLTN